MENQNTSLAVKYRPRQFSDIVSQDAIRTILENQIKTGTFQHCYLFTGSSGVGKCLSLNANVLTPNGYVCIKDIKVGDKVFDGNGNLTEVVGSYPQKQERQMYRITFNDKTYIDVSDNHLNNVFIYNKKLKKKEYLTLNTLELIEEYRHLQEDFSRKFYLRVEVPIIKFKKQSVSIDPYLLGNIIADGTTSSSRMIGFCLPEEDIKNKISKILKKDFSLKLNYRDKYDYQAVSIQDIHNNQFKPTKNKLKQNLTDLGLFGKKSEDKFIPQEYLLNDFDTRLELLKGLFDADGFVSNRINHKGYETCYYEYSTASKQLSDDFAFLVRSLGCVDTITRDKAGYKDNDGVYHRCLDRYRHYVKVPNDLIIVSSKKHLDKVKDRQAKEPIRKIMSIEKLKKEKCKCIKVKSKSETFITDNFTPTHNTTIARAFANKLNEGIADIIEVDGASNNGVDNIREIIKQAEQQSLISKYKVIIIDECHQVSPSGQNALLKTLEDCPKNTIFILCTTDPQKVLPTIKSRCQTFQLSRISASKIVERLKYICEEENKLGRSIKYDENALQFIAQRSLGGMRLSISYLDTCLALSNELTIENVVKSLGMNEIEVYFDLLYGIYNKDIQYCIKILDKMFYDGVEIKQFIKGFFSFVLDCSLFKIFNNSFLNTQIPDTDKNRNELIGYDEQQIVAIHNMLQLLVDKIKYEQNPLQMFKSAILSFCKK